MTNTWLIALFVLFRLTGYLSMRMAAGLIV